SRSLIITGTPRVDSAIFYNRIKGIRVSPCSDRYYVHMSENTKDLLTFPVFHVSCQIAEILCCKPVTLTYFKKSFECFFWSRPYWRFLCCLFIVSNTVDTKQGKQIFHKGIFTFFRFLFPINRLICHLSAPLFIVFTSLSYHFYISIPNIE